MSGRLLKSHILFSMLALILVAGVLYGLGPAHLAALTTMTGTSTIFSRVQS